jgi:hypothetical protein
MLTLPQAELDHYQQTRDAVVAGLQEGDAVALNCKIVELLAALANELATEIADWNDAVKGFTQSNGNDEDLALEIKWRINAQEMPWNPSPPLTPKDLKSMTAEKNDYETMYLAKFVGSIKVGSLTVYETTHAPLLFVLPFFLSTSTLHFAFRFFVLFRD